LDKLEYRKQIWQLLKEYEADKDMSLEEVLDKIMALPVPGARGQNNI